LSAFPNGKPLASSVTRTAIPRSLPPHWRQPVMFR